jgi:hypothetical protein
MPPNQSSSRIPRNQTFPPNLVGLVPTNRRSAGATSRDSSRGGDRDNGKAHCVVSNLRLSVRQTSPIWDSPR